MTVTISCVGGRVPLPLHPSRPSRREPTAVECPLCPFGTTRAGRHCMAVLPQAGRQAHGQARSHLRKRLGRDAVFGPRPFQVGGRGAWTRRGVTLEGRVLDTEGIEHTAFPPWWILSDAASARGDPI